MKVVVRTTPLKLALDLLQRLLFTAAVMALGYSGFVLADGWLFQHREDERFDLMLRSPPPVPDVGLVGRMEIPRLNLSVMVVEGTGKSVLDRAAGHIVGTGLPGTAGNVGIAAHRDTLFRPLRNIKRDDIVTLTTLRGLYHYRVVSMKVVSPSDVAVLDPDGDEILTLVTCYPFYFIGSAPDRFIVRAKRLFDGRNSL